MTSPAVAAAARRGGGGVAERALRAARLLAAPRSLLWAAMAAYALGFSALSVLRHDAYNTGRFDLGNMVQAVWSTAHGHPLRMSDIQGDQISRLAAHVDPILVLFAPLWLAWPSPNLLVVAQSIAIALGALPVFWLARKHLGSERVALGFALAYLLQPAGQWLALNEFHPVALALPLLLFAFWWLDEGRLLPFALVALLACATKEEIPLAVSGLGLWYALSRRRWRPGLLIALAGLAWALIAVEIVVPHFNAGASSEFYSRYGDVGGSPGGILRAAVTHPLRIVEHAFDQQNLGYLARLALPLLLFAFWWLDEGRLLPFALVALLACATKEEIPLAVCGMGLWYALSRRHWRTGLLIALVGLAWALIAVEVVIPHFNAGASSEFYLRYGDIGGSPGGVLRTAVTHPLRIVEHAFDHQGIRYLAQLALPLGVLWALSPLALLVSLPDLALNLLSQTSTQSSIHFHYTAGVLPGLVVASIFGAARLRRARPARIGGLAAALVVLALVANWHLGAIPFWREVWGGEKLGAYDTRVSEHDRIADRVLQQVPGSAVVSATNSLGAHLSARRRILSFPRLLDATWIAVDETKLSTYDRLVALPAAQRLVTLRRDPRWELVASEDGILLFRRAPRR